MLALWEFTWNSWPVTPISFNAQFSVISTLTTTAGASQVGSAQSSNGNFSVPTSSTVITLPVGSAAGGVISLFLKVTGNFPVTISWQPFQGTNNVVKTLQPGSWIAFEDAAFGSGIIALSVQAIGGTSSIAYFLLG